jgi:cytochrome P450
MNDRQVRDEAVTLAITGYETIGDALTWSWYLLAQHPDVEERVWVEIRDLLAGRSPSAVDVPALRYTEMVLSEAIRLYPLTWLFVRMAGAADVLPSGAAIPEDAKIYLSPYVMHRQARYFPEPDQFDPSRRRARGARRRHPCNGQRDFSATADRPRACQGVILPRMLTRRSLMRTPVRREIGIGLIHV